MSRVQIIIPARLASTRFPAKPLAPLTGADGIARPALHYTWEAGCAAARALSGAARCVIATDDAQIAHVASAASMDVVMTPVTCANGTERCAAALEALHVFPEIVVNLQGDAPLTPPAEQLLPAFPGPPDQHPSPISLPGAQTATCCPGWCRRWRR